MQQLEEPRLISEKEDIHLIDSFLISTKPNEAGWQISKNAVTPIQEWVGKDFVMIPEKIFDETQEQPGHSTGETIEDDWEEIKRHSHGKITKVKGPYSYNDGTDDFYYKVNVKLKDTLSASALVENGSKTWTPFAVSPQIIRHEGPRNNVIRYTPMGLFLVIKGAYGDQSVVNKMCSGSELKCGTKLSAAIHQLNHDTTDAHLAETLTSYISVVDKNKVEMSTQVTPDVKTITTDNTQPTAINVPFTIQPVSQPDNWNPKVNNDKKEETFDEEAFKAKEKEKQEKEEILAEISQLKKERNETILNTVFGSIEDQEIKNKVLEGYKDVKDARIVKQVYEDLNKHIIPKLVEAKLAESKNDQAGKKESASILKPEPKIVKDEKLNASIESTDDLSVSECRSILGL